MSSIIGRIVRYTLFGSSHGPVIGMTIDGLPAGIKIDDVAIRRSLERRKTGQLLTSQRREADVVQWLSGYKDGYTTGAALTFTIANSGQNSADYRQVETVMRPSHADYPANVKYGGYCDRRGGGIFSAGSIVRQLLTEQGIALAATLHQLGELSIPAAATVDYSSAWLDGLTPVWRQRVVDYLSPIAAAGDSLGGTVRLCATGLPIGLGEPPFYSVEAALSQYLFAIPGLKAIGFGSGSAFATARGSAVADQMQYKDQKVDFLSNHNGGALGGLTTGQALQVDCVFKPTPSIALAQSTIDVARRENATLRLTGRHDPAFVIRTPVIVEAVAAMTLYDLWRCTC